MLLIVDKNQLSSYQVEEVVLGIKDLVEIQESQNAHRRPLWLQLWIRIQPSWKRARTIYSSWWMKLILGHWLVLHPSEPSTWARGASPLKAFCRKWTFVVSSVRWWFDGYYQWQGGSATHQATHDDCVCSNPRLQLQLCRFLPTKLFSFTALLHRKAKGVNGPIALKNLLKTGTRRCAAIWAIIGR